MNLVIAVILSYVLGSIPTAYLAGRMLKGIDIREHGSGNVGASNTFRVLGRTPGICVLVIDILKGFLAVVLVNQVLGIGSTAGIVLVGVAAVCGHNWTLFLGFRGGKGIAASLGVLIGLTVAFPSLIPVVLVSVLSWAAVLYWSHFISLSSIVAACVLPVAMFVTGQEFEMIFLGAVFCIFVVYRHSSNISRIAQGTEPKVRIFDRF